MIRLVIDTDPGMGTTGADPEDGMAILYALNSPEVVLEGITLVHGNVPISHSWPNVVHLLELAGRSEILVHVGAARPRYPERRRMQTAGLEYREMMKGTVPPRPLPEESAAEFLRDTILASPGEITVVTIGPLTNMAAAIESDPAVATQMAGLVMMGGTVEVPGNITPAAEFNVWMDPEAAAVVFDSGAPITMVGLDVCHRTHFDREQVAHLRAGSTPLAAFVSEAAESWAKLREGFEGDPAFHLYDSLALAAAIEPDLLDCRRALVQVETSEGPAQGMTVSYLNDVLRMLIAGRDHNTTVAVGVDVDRFAERFAERVAGCI